MPGLDPLGRRGLLGQGVEGLRQPLNDRQRLPRLLEPLEQPGAKSRFPGGRFLEAAPSDALSDVAGRRQ